MPVSQKPRKKREIQLNEELVFKYPEEPKLKDTILNHGKKKSDQKWRRAEDLPPAYFAWNESVAINQEQTEWQNGVLIALNVEDTNEIFKLRERELERRQEGVWIYINGELFYFTGDFYFFLTYCYMPGAGYPDFRKFQMKIFYVIQMVLQSPDILGVYFQKAKKTGLSQIIVSVFLNHATMTREKSFGFMNKTQPDANSVNMALFKAAYDKLPAILAPKATKLSEQRLIFGNPPAKYTGTDKSLLKIAAAKLSNPLDTWIFTAATVKEPKFDGPKMYLINLDEMPKYKISPAGLLEKIAETVKLQQTIIGKIFITSYPPEKDTDAFYECKEIYYNSKLSTIKDPINWNRTGTGLIAYYVGALQSTDGTFDEYGNADEVMALKRNQAERDNCKTPEALQAKIRQYSRTEEESWRSGGSGSSFDNIRLAQGNSLLEENLRKGIISYIDLNLHWRNGIRYGKVDYSVVTEEEKINEKKIGWFRVYEMPFDEDLNKIYEDSDGYYTPSSDTKHVGAVDPTDYVDTGDMNSTTPSDNSITILSHFDTKRDTYFQRPASRKMIISYNGRKPDANDFIEDLTLLLFWTGAYIIIEANKKWVLKKMKDNGLQNFLLVKKLDGTIMPYKFGEENMSINTTKETVNTLCRVGNSYFKKPQEEGMVDYCLHIGDVDYYEDLMKFNARKTQPHHRTMSFLYALLALDSFDAYKEYLYKREEYEGNIKAFGDYLLNRT